MKKGFTMIELIFVIVILGILASVAIPRLAATKTDAETSAAIGNLRTLMSDVSANYVAQGKFGETTFQEVSNVKVADNTKPLTTGTTLGGSKNDCFTVQFFEAEINKDTGKLTRPAYGTVTQSNKSDSICAQIGGAPAIRALTEAKFKSDGKDVDGIAIGSGSSIYGDTATDTKK